MPLITAPLLDTVAVTPRCRLLAIDTFDVRFNFRPGQAVLIGAHGHGERRPYSIACSPEAAAEHSKLELLVALEPDGTLGPHLASLAPGSLVDVDGPLGNFLFPEPPEQQRLLFVAGGTGIAPLRSMLDHAIRRHRQNQVSLLYSARHSDEFAFIDEFREHEQAGRLELHPTVTRDEDAAWSGKRGRIDRSHFESVLHEPAATLCFVCGPPAMVVESVATLNALGVPAAQIRTEGWGR